MAHRRTRSNGVPADLTQIAKSNGGIFPSKKVAEIIDGRASVAAHGARDMPVWGDRYRVVTEAGESAAEVEKRARAQISALVEYLETIQEKWRRRASRQGWNSSKWGFALLPAQNPNSRPRRKKSRKQDRSAHR